MADDRDYVRLGEPTRQPTIVVLKGYRQVRRVKRNYCEYCFFCSFLLLSTLHVALCLVSRRMHSADYCHSHAFFLFSLSTLLYVLHAQLVVIFVFFALCLFCRWLSSLYFSCASSLSTFRVSRCRHRRHHLCCRLFIMCIILIIVVLVVIAAFCISCALISFFVLFLLRRHLFLSLVLHPYLSMFC